MNNDAAPAGLAPEAGSPGADIVGALPAVVWIADPVDRRMRYVSPRARDLLGHDPAEWLASIAFWETHVHADDLERANRAISNALDAAVPVHVRYRFQTAGGEYRWILDSIQVIKDDPRGGRLVGVMVDITDDRLELEALETERTRLAARVDPSAVLSPPGLSTVVDGLNDGVYCVDTERRITYWNRGAQRLTGYRGADVVGQSCYDNLLAHVDGVGNALCSDGCLLQATLADGSEREGVVWLRHANGSRRRVRVRVAPVRAEGGSDIVGAVQTFSDASDLVQAGEAVAAARQDALTDPVTGLANRRMLDIILGTRMGELNGLGLPFGLLMIDVDDFTQFSDRYGREAGDAALRVVAETLSGAVRGDETVARWGGGEFSVVAARVDEEELTRLAERILALVRATRIDTGGEAVPVQVSIGGLLARAGEPLLVLFGRADQALLKAKTTGRDRFVLADDAPFAG